MDFKELIDTCQIAAIDSLLNSTESSVYRSMCRSYSKSFSTPLHLVLEMDPEHVMLNVYEDQLDGYDLDDMEKVSNLLESILQIEDPTYFASKKQDDEDFAKQAELEEEERIKSGRPIPGFKKSLLSKPVETEENRPQGGSVNFDYLSKLDKEE